MDSVDAAATAIDLNSTDPRAWFTTVCEAVGAAEAGAFTWEEFTAQLRRLADVRGQATLASAFVEHLERDSDWQSTVKAMRDRGVDALIPTPTAEWDEGVGLFRRYNSGIEQYEYAATQDADTWECFVDGRWLRYDAETAAWQPGTLPTAAASGPTEWDEAFGLFRRYNDGIEQYEYAATQDADTWECFVDGRWLRYDAETAAWQPGSLPVPTIEAGAEQPNQLTENLADVVRSLLDEVPEARDLSQEELSELLREALHGSVGANT